MRAEPGDARNLSTLGIACYRAGKWKLAVKALKKALKSSSSGDTETWLVLAMAHWRHGERNEARRVYEKALEWLEENEPEDKPTEEALRALRVEARGLLGTRQVGDG